jgi:hypothetical protein
MAIDRKVQEMIASSPEARTYEDDDDEAPLVETRAMVIKPHTAQDPSQLNLAVNDIVIVLEKDESGWWGGHKEVDPDFIGWFPGVSCIELRPEILDQHGATELDSAAPTCQTMATGPQTMQSSPNRGSRSVPSPQVARSRQEIHNKNESSSIAEAVEAAGREYAAEVAKLRSQLAEERAAKEEAKQVAKEKEEQLKLEIAAKRRLSSDLERERRRSEVHIEENMQRKQKEQAYLEELRNKEAALREAQEKQRRYSQSAKLAEDRASKLQEELRVMSTTKKAARPSDSAEIDIQIDPRRRLFSSTCDTSSISAASPVPLVRPLTRPSESYANPRPVDTSLMVRRRLSTESAEVQAGPSPRPRAFTAASTVPLMQPAAALPLRKDLHAAARGAATAPVYTAPTVMYTPTGVGLNEHPPVGAVASRVREIENRCPTPRCPTPRCSTPTAASRGGGGALSARSAAAPARPAAPPANYSFEAAAVAEPWMCANTSINESYTEEPTLGLSPLQSTRE